MNVPRIQLVIYILGFLCFQDLVGASLIIPLIIIQVRDLGTSHVVAGAISSVYGILQLVTGPVMGRWSDISGRRPVILLCMMATAVSYIVLGSSQSLVIIILGRIIAGVFKHSQTLCRALLADVTTPEDRSRVFGVFNATSSMGFIVGPMLGGHLSELEDGFSIVCNLGALFFVVDFVIFWMFIPDISPLQQTSTKETSEGENLKQMFAFMKDINWQIFGDIFLIRFFLSFSSLVYRSNFSLLIDQNFGVSPKVIGYLISFQGIISAVAGFFTGRVSNFYRDSQKELFHSSILLTVALIGLTIAPSLTTLLMCLIPLCISTAVIRVSSSAITIGLCDPSKVGSVTGFGQSIASVARMVTPLIAGVTQEISVYGPGVMGTLSAGVGALLAGYMVQKAKLKEE
ncbi:major facilitator superfamily domain-containing protein 9-like isoform X2 [Palaemon carinicauda]|uniref:major facilitator superfamily domain-containing protein 9-like isoform X2 n=1 Tax=Palaemon carinicauda TaxID=392227 RepID=UPI0035B675C0